MKEIMKAIKKGDPFDVSEYFDSEMFQQGDGALPYDFLEKIGFKDVHNDPRWNYLFQDSTNGITVFQDADGSYWVLEENLTMVCTGCGLDTMMHLGIQIIIDDYWLTTSDVAKSTNLATSRIRQLATNLFQEGYAIKTGRDWRFRPEAEDWIKNQPDGRGRPREITRISSDSVLSFLDMELGTAKKSQVLAIYRAADGEGTIQNHQMLELFPGKPTLHTTCSIRRALIAAGCREKTY